MTKTKEQLLLFYVVLTAFFKIFYLKLRVKKETCQEGEREACVGNVPDCTTGDTKSNKKDKLAVQEAKKTALTILVDSSF